MAISVVILIVIVSIFFAKTDFTKHDLQKKVLGEQQISVSTTPSLTPTPTLVSTPSATGKPTPTTTNNSHVTIKQVVKDNSSNSQSFGISDFKYPSSTQVNSSGNNLNLESNDNPDTITNWYKEKITSLGFKSKSFVQTKNNGNVLNKLVGASSNKEIRVDITKSAGSSSVSITISLLDT